METSNVIFSAPSAVFIFQHILDPEWSKKIVLSVYKKKLGVFFFIAF